MDVEGGVFRRNWDMDVRLDGDWDGDRDRQARWDEKKLLISMKDSFPSPFAFAFAFASFSSISTNSLSR